MIMGRTAHISQATELISLRGACNVRPSNDVKKAARWAPTFQRSFNTPARLKRELLLRK